MKMRVDILCISILVLLLLAACGGARTQAILPATPTQNPFSTIPPTTAPTYTPLPTYTLTPTPTPQPTDTPEPTPVEAALPGWEKYEARGMEIWLPESFEGGDLENDLEVIVATLRALGPDFEQTAALIEANPTAFVLWTFDTEIGPGSYLTNMNIIREQVLSAVTLEMYLQAVAQQLPAYLTIVEQDQGQLERYESYRLVISTEVSGVQGYELMYLIKDGNTVWAITYATAADEFEARLPVFEQSVSTFTTQP